MAFAKNIGKKNSLIYMGGGDVNMFVPRLLRHIYIYLFIRMKRGIMKVKIYKGFTYVHCLFVVAVIGNEEC
jgi:hypothetical protein